MAKSLQKPANTLRELPLSHPGIITAEAFNDHFDLRCYEPSPDLQSFVVHLWTQRPKRPLDPLHRPPIEIRSGPNVYLFFTPTSAFIQGIAKHEFTYDPRAQGVTVGIKFRPGGFYPFLGHAVSRLATPQQSITSVFAQANDDFRTKLLAQPDQIIVPMLEDLLRSKHPKHTQNLTLVAKIVSALHTDSSLRTVSATAQAFGISQRSLQLLFQTYVGVGVKWIITRRRLLEAITRAQNQPHVAWVQIAAELGYSSQSHFSRDFKEVTGLPPTEYLRSLD